MQWECFTNVKPRAKTRSYGHAQQLDNSCAQGVLHSQTSPRTSESLSGMQGETLVVARERYQGHGGKVGLEGGLVAEASSASYEETDGHTDRVNSEAGSKVRPPAFNFLIRGLALSLLLLGKT